MAKYQYKGRDAQGALITGQLDAVNAEAVATQLNSRGLIPLSIQEVAAAAGNSFDFAKLFRKRISVEELIIFSRQMHSLNKAGVPIIRALRGLAGSIKNETLKETLYDVADTLESGVDLASSLNRHPEIFSPLYVSVIHVGENTGRLDLAFKQVAGYLELERDTKKRIGEATRYPLFVIVAIVIAIGVINVLVVPAFAKLFSSFNAELPWQTQFLISCSNFTVNNWYWLLLAIIGSILACRYYIATDIGGLNWDRMKLRIPLVGGIFERINLGRFARTYAMVARAGVPIIQALNVVGSAVGNRYIESKINAMRTRIERGENFSRVAQNSGMFSELVLQMISVGEETGTMDDLLDEVADFYEQEVDYDLKSLGDKIEPILLLIVAGMVLILALGVFLPMWDLSSAVKGR
ncbi:MAG: type II secretion system F family protein [Pseudomonadales bacterium]|nr:type II secretion system F family protein [Pseudomonadales bacterium]